ncbi:DUF2892 domain-containing protein [Paraburkholderia phymatum]|uniref:YgaP family membrane protein n=1 Tax=Paraburkholderia phymatum TaxID=148447 RepID=UPI00317C844D
MFYVKNVPGWERVIRIVLGVVGAALAIMFLKGVAGIVGALAAAGITISGLVGFCLACAMVGRRLARQQKR